MTKFGERYELVRRVGAGGMAEVWLAHDEELAGRPVAIKIMHKHMLPNEDDVARFEREMRFAALMAHPNIVTVYTTGTCGDTPFLVMEYLRGHDLEKVMLGDDPEHIAGIGRDVCSGLAYAHSEGVIHRDIKPANLFLCDTGQIKITDFGVARAVSETALSTAVLVGTFAYMPPERWRGEPSAFSGDVWAAGCVLYRLISGRPPRLLPDVGHYAAAATRGEPVPDLRDITDAPDWLTVPVMAMLEDDPACRPTAGECVQALSGASFSVPFPRLPIGDWRLPGQRGRRELVAAETGGATGGAASEDPVTTPVARRAVARAAVRRSRRLNRGATAVGGMALLLLAGSLTAWQLSTSPPGAGPAAAGLAPPAANHAAAAPATSASAPRTGSSATAPPDPASTAAPAHARSGSAAGSASATPTGSRSAGPGGSPRSSPTSSPTPSAADSAPPSSAPPSSTPPLVPVPDVIGMNFNQAQRTLESNGFTVAGVRNRHGTKVTSESPSGEAPQGSVITVTYGT